jgi:plasmid stabilization system protein ParE
MGEFQLRITSQAARDLHEIVAYIARDNPTAAERVGLALVGSRKQQLLWAKRLESFPQRTPA